MTVAVAPPGRVIFVLQYMLPSHRPLTTARAVCQTNLAGGRSWRLRPTQRRSLLARPPASGCHFSGGSQTASALSRLESARTAGVVPALGPVGFSSSGAGSLRTLSSPSGCFPVEGRPGVSGRSAFRLVNRPGPTAFGETGLEPATSWPQTKRATNRSPPRLPPAGLEPALVAAATALPEMPLSRIASWLRGRCGAVPQHRVKAVLLLPSTSLPASAALPSSGAALAAPAGVRVAASAARATFAPTASVSLTVGHHGLLSRAPALSQS